MRNQTIFSFGHSNRSLNEFINKLKEYKIEILVDARSIPQSRFCPHFNKNALLQSLESQGIKYLWKGKNIGGRGLNEKYDETIDELVSMTKAGSRICIICSEGDYHKCHRYTVLTPSFEAKGLKVEHIQYNPK
jgi:uncharacterized protein (DUF488 family)